ncbi:hypothetical protein JCM10213_007890 [Rhodosporidiobolus nylandii]
MLLNPRSTPQQRIHAHEKMAELEREAAAQEGGMMLDAKNGPCVSLSSLLSSLASAPGGLFPALQRLQDERNSRSRFEELQLGDHTIAPLEPDEKEEGVYIPKEQAEELRRVLFGGKRE